MLLVWGPASVGSPDMIRPHAVLATLALCAGLFAATPAFANDSFATPTDFSWNTLRAAFDMRAQTPAIRTALDPMRVQSIQQTADAPGFAGVRLFAGGSAYAVGRRSTGYGLEGGAALPIDEGIQLTASYRLIGFALGDRLDPEFADVQARTGAPYFGIDFDF